MTTGQKQHEGLGGELHLDNVFGCRVITNHLPLLYCDGFALHVFGCKVITTHLPFLLLLCLTHEPINSLFRKDRRRVRIFSYNPCT